MRRLSVIYIVAAGIAWGTAGLFVAFLTKFGFSSAELASARCFTAAILGLTFVALSDRRSLALTLKQFIFCGASGIAFYSMAAFYYSAMKAASVPTASVMLNMAPILVIIFSVFFFGEKLTLKKVFAIFSAIAGCALVAGVADGFTVNPKGLLYGFIAMASYAVYSICVKYAMDDGVHPAVATAYCFAFGAVSSLVSINPAAFVTRIVSCPWYVGVLLVMLGAVTGFFATFMYSKAMKGLPAGVVSAMASIEPLTSTVLSVAVLGQSVTLFSALGIVIILVSVAVLGADKKEK